MQSRLRAALVLVLPLGLLAFFCKDVNLGDVWTATRQAEPRLLALSVGIMLMIYTFRALRWQYLLAPIGRTHFSTAFQAAVIGCAVSFLLPARPGEVLRPYLLAKREGLPATACFATIILERLLDLVTVLLLFGAFVVLVDPASLSADPTLYARVKTGGLIAAAGAVVGLFILFVLAGHPERLGAWALRLERVLPAGSAGLNARVGAGGGPGRGARRLRRERVLPGRIAQLIARVVEGFAQGLVVLRRPAPLLGSVALSFPMW